MDIETWIAVGVIVLIVALAAGYVIKSKKSGKTCIGCPDCCNCPHGGSCSGGNRSCKNP